MKMIRERRPNIECEISSTHLAAARIVAGGGSNKFSVQGLPNAAVTPSLSGRNIADREAVRVAVCKSVESIIGRSRDISVIVPDACCRLALIEVDILPQKPEEAETLLRFHMKKSLPFEIDKARLRWQVQSASGTAKVLVATMFKDVLEEYESVVRDAGYNPGEVIPSVLSSLRLVDAGIPTLLIKLAPTTVSVVIVHNRAVVLIRVLERRITSRPEATKLADAACPSLAFFEDKYNTKIQKILISGDEPLKELAAALENSTGVQAQELMTLTSRTQGARSASGESGVSAASA